MKKFFFLILCVSLLSACGGSGDADKKDQDTTVTTELKQDAQNSDQILDESVKADAEADSLLNSL